MSNSYFSSHSLRVLLLIVASVFVSLSFFAEGEDQGLEALILALGASDSDDRQEAMDQVVLKATQDLDAVLLVLHSEAVLDDPQVRFQLSKILKEIFLRVELGGGEVDLGLTFGRYFFFDEEQLPATLPIVTKVARGSDGAKAGLVRGDVIQSIDGGQIPLGDGYSTFNEMVKGLTPGTELELEVLRLKVLGNLPRKVQKAKYGKRLTKTLVVGSTLREVPREEFTEVRFQAWKEAFEARLNLK